MHRTNILSTLPRRIIAAPMAGGPSTPHLVAAAARAGGLGFLAAGYLTVEAMATEIATTRKLLTEHTAHDTASAPPPFGVNLFITNRADSEAASTPADITAYRGVLGEVAAHLTTDIPDPAYTDYFSSAKMSYLIDHPVPLVSFTFGVPPVEVIAALQRAGTAVAITVTGPADADTAVAAGADILIAQGTEAGGHRSTFTIAEQPNTTGTLALTAELAARHPTTPLVAAGGIHSPAAIAAALSHGAAAVQLGTALLLVDVSGASAVHRTGLRRHFADGAASTTVVTRAYSGRPARAVATSFTRRCGPVAPAAYPYINEMTRPVRAAAASSDAEDAWNYAALWCGEPLADTTSDHAADYAAARAPREGQAAAVMAELWDDAQLLNQSR